jgi:acyl-CoA synthetase (AMP-forming)/AMP-acid ligase II
MTEVLLPLKIEQNASSHGDAVAVQCGGQTRTWSDFERQTRRVAAALGAMDCGPGARVAILAASSIAHIEVLVGILRSGASAVPLPGLASADTLAHMLADSGARAVFTSGELHPLADQALAGDNRISRNCRVSIDFSARHWCDLAGLASAAPSKTTLPTISPDQEFNLIYSSGTTGTPKGIIHSHQTRTAQMAAAALAGIDRKAVTLISTALYANWTLFGLFASLYGGGTTLLLPRFDSRECLRLLRDDQVTHAFLVPVQITRLLADVDFDQYVQGGETMKLCAGSPLPVSVKRELLRRWPGGLVENYGLTEGAPTTLLFADLHPQKLESVGSVVPGGEIRIINEEGRELPHGETGEVVGRTEAMMDGYLNRADLTAELEWIDESGRRFFRSGDFGRLDSDGFLYLMGRKKDVIISGGMNIYASDIEEVLMTHPEVAEAAVIGIPSEQWGETPLALIVLPEGSDIGRAALRDWANARLGKAQRLHAVEFRASLPRGTLDKVLKNELRQPYWPGHGASG